MIAGCNKVVDIRIRNHNVCRAEILPKEQPAGTKKENGQAPAKKPKLAGNGQSVER